MNAGARGYLVKDASREELSAMVTQALADSSSRRSAPRSRPDSPGGMPVLTGRELQVLRGWRGRSNSEIGKGVPLRGHRQDPCPPTVPKLGAADRAQAVAMGFRWGLVR